MTMTTMMQSATVLFLCLVSTLQGKPATDATFRNLMAEDGLPDAFCGYPVDALTIPPVVTADPWAGDRLAYCNRDAITPEACEVHDFWDGYQCYWQDGVCKSDAPMGGGMHDTTCPRHYGESQCRSTAVVAKRPCAWRVRTEAPSMVPTAVGSMTPTMIPSSSPSVAPSEVPTELPTEEANVDFVARQSDGSPSEVQEPDDSSSSGSKMGGSGWTTIAFVGFAAAGGIFYYRRRQRKAAEAANENQGSPTQQSTGQGPVSVSHQAPVGPILPTTLVPPGTGVAPQPVITTFAAPTTYVIETHPVPTPPAVAWLDTRQAGATPVHSLQTQLPPTPPAPITTLPPAFQV